MIRVLINIRQRRKSSPRITVNKARIVEFIYLIISNAHKFYSIKIYLNVKNKYLINDFNRNKYLACSFFSLFFCINDHISRTSCKDFNLRLNSSWNFFPNVFKYVNIFVDMNLYRCTIHDTILIDIIYLFN